MPNIVQRRYRRKEAAEYLEAHHGVKRAPATLAKLAVIGGGPRFYKAGARTVLYDADELDRWAVELLGRPLSSTSDYA
jgi:hypothetical protein